MLAVNEVYFDEDVPWQLADILRIRGVTVHLPNEIDTVSADDAIHLQRSSKQGWVLITQNRRDFRRLHWMWMTFHYWGIIDQPHGGILTIYEQRPELPDDWANAIYNVLQRYDNLNGLMFMWRPSIDRWESQPVRFI